MSDFKNRMTSLFQEKEDEKIREKAEREKERKDLDAAIEEVGGEEASEIMGEKVGFNLKPLKPLLHPIQELLIVITKYLRLGRNVLSGDVSEKQDTSF